MEIAETSAVLGIVVTSVIIIIAVFLGPSLFSSYQNWRIRRGDNKK